MVWFDIQNHLLSFLSSSSVYLFPNCPTETTISLLSQRAVWNNDHTIGWEWICFSQIVQYVNVLCKIRFFKISSVTSIVMWLQDYDKIINILILTNSVFKLCSVKSSGNFLNDNIFWQWHLFCMWTRSYNLLPQLIEGWHNYRFLTSFISFLRKKKFYETST